ncbi:glutamate ABC transporter substrate-binding protein [Luedemannella helvata]|uniref:Glutamate ABC transporter substrate-binding protein n=1 Tax=Luedemannella helvata TaxID=349315 RepID=A0ABP4WSR1_9ACTN
MSIKKIATIVALAALAIAPAACGKEGTPTPSTPGGTGAAPVSDACADTGITYTAATPSLTGSPTYDRAKGAGKIVIGVKFDQPNLGYKDTQGKRCGFDIEIARYLASKLGFDESKIEYKEIASANRETELKGGGIDYYVGTYSITDQRKNDVSFAGPYFIAGQDLLVRKDESAITGKETLQGKKVCSATGSTPIQRVRDEKLTDPANISEFKTYSECVSQLLDGKTDAVTTDDAILKGYAAQSPDKLKVVGKPFSTEKYGIGLAKDDKALRDFINDALDASFKDGTWQKIYDATLGKSGSPATAPPLERY